MGRRLRWENVARAAGAAVVLAAVAAWPRLAPPAPSLPGGGSMPLGGVPTVREGAGGENGPSRAAARRARERRALKERRAARRVRERRALKERHAARRVRERRASRRARERRALKEHRPPSAGDERRAPSDVGERRAPVGGGDRQAPPEGDGPAAPGRPAPADSEPRPGGMARPDPVAAEFGFETGP